MHKPTSVFICGNYGGRTGQIDGQTIKTRVLREGFAQALGEAKVSALDSSHLAANPIRFLKQARRGIRESAQTVMLPGSRGLQLLFPFLLYWGQKWDRPLRYVVIGGWLPDLLARKRWLRHLCSGLNGIYVETPDMASKLSSLGLTRVQVLPNFRQFDRTLKLEFAPATRPLKLVFYSRVMKEKGIEEAIAAITKLNQAGIQGTAATLDVYGPIPTGYRSDLNGLLGQSPEVHYRGVLPPEGVHAVLQNYDLMLFPTYYEGEGFPGAIVDAFIAGVPVLASDWKYNRELIDEGKTGVICAPGSVDDVVLKLRQFITCPNQILAMRQHCLQKSKDYHVENAVQHLLRDMACEMPLAPSAIRIATRQNSFGGYWQRLTAPFRQST